MVQSVNQRNSLPTICETLNRDVKNGLFKACIAEIRSDKDAQDI